MTSGKKTPIVKAFGRHLATLRGQRKRSQVSRVLWDLHQVKCDPSTLGHYEKGRVVSPDPVVLLGLAKVYDSDVERLITLLKADRAAHTNGRDLARLEVDKVLQEVGVTHATQAAAASRLAEVHHELTRHVAQLGELAARLEPAFAPEAEAVTRRAPSPRHSARSSA